MHQCEAKVALAGDMRQVVVFDRFNPVSWPETVVLRVLHGDDAVYDVSPFEEIAADPRAERERLAYKYGEQVYEIFPGHMPLMEMQAPGVRVPPAGLARLMATEHHPMPTPEPPPQLDPEPPPELDPEPPEESPEEEMLPPFEEPVEPGGKRRKR